MHSSRRSPADSGSTSMVRAEWVDFQPQSGAVRTTALEWVRKAGLVTLSPVDGLESVVGYVVGANPPKRWWSHPKGTEIYNLFANLSAHRSIAVTKLVEGKVTLVHRRLWPALVRLGQDPCRLSAQAKSLPTSARKLFALVQKKGAIRLDTVLADWPGGSKQLKKDRTALEQKALVMSHDEHTSSGTHYPVLESWKSFRERRHVPVPAGLTAVDAARKLQAAAGDHKLTAS